MGPDLVLDLVVAGELAAARVDAEVARGAPLGRAVLHSFLDDEPRRHHGDRGAVRAGHRGILGSGIRHIDALEHVYGRAWNQS